MKNRDWYTSLVSGLLFPLQERLKDHSTVSVPKALEVSQWWNRERLEDLQLLKLRHLLAEAEAHVPYYRGIFAENSGTNVAIALHNHTLVSQTPSAILNPLVKSGGWIRLAHAG